LIRSGERPNAFKARMVFLKYGHVGFVHIEFCMEFVLVVEATEGCNEDTRSRLHRHYEEASKRSITV
jgi:hypothetical protein